MISYNSFGDSLMETIFKKPITHISEANTLEVQQKFGVLA